ncbi:MAG: hypothetical protein J0M24_15250 [Verrucomicrobia bacterium]|nr:hypothetical protein [Verrucomicrobiota bacterium]
MPYVTCFERYALKRGMQRGLRKGLRLGRNEGRSEGRIEGRVEGRSEGEALGQAEGLRRALCEVLRSRWEVVPPAVVQRLESTQDPEQLSRWLRLAVLTPSLEAFFEAFAASDH